MKLPEMSVIDTHLPSNYKIRGYTAEQMLAWGKANAEAEREACCAIVYGLCGSDNEAQRIVDAIRARGTT
jgi:hypothetical protein